MIVEKSESWVVFSLSKRKFYFRIEKLPMRAVYGCYEHRHKYHKEIFFNERGWMAGYNESFY